MKPSGSYAVMAQRREPHDSLDWFPTPPWSTRALCEHVIGTDWKSFRAWEPACGDGSMSRPLTEYFGAVSASDVHDYGWGHLVHDFLQPFEPENFSKPDFVITNPPFKICEQFIRRGLEVATMGVAVLVRTTFIEGMGRYRDLFSVTPPTTVAQFSERVPMVKGRLDRTASSATAYCWIVWRKHGSPHTELIWVPPCRAKLERDSDYPLGVQSRSLEPQLTGPYDAGTVVPVPPPTILPLEAAE